MANETIYVTVSRNDDSEINELPTEEDGTLGLQMLQNVFPGAQGLKYRIPETRKFRVLKIDETRAKFHAPDGGWSNKVFIVLPPLTAIQATTTSSKTSSSIRQLPARKRPRIANDDSDLSYCMRVEKNMQNEDVEAIGTLKKKINPYIFYYHSKGDGHRSSLIAISRKYGVTYAHGSNERRKVDDTFDVFPLVGNENAVRNAVQVKVKSICQVLDYQLVVAVNGYLLNEDPPHDFFFRAYDSAESTPYIVVGFSSKTELYGKEEFNATYFHGMLACSKPRNERLMVVGDSIAWPGDSGGGVFSTEGKFIGMVSGSISFGPNSDTGFTRTKIVPSVFFEIAMEIAEGRDPDEIRTPRKE